MGAPAVLGRDLLVAKVDAAGRLVWSQRFDGTSEQAAYVLAVAPGVRQRGGLALGRSFLVQLAPWLPIRSLPTAARLPRPARPSE